MAVLTTATARGQSRSCWRCGGAREHARGDVAGTPAQRRVGSPARHASGARGPPSWGLSSCCVLPTSCCVSVTGFSAMTPEEGTMDSPVVELGISNPAFSAIQEELQVSTPFESTRRGSRERPCHLARAAAGNQ